MTNSFGILHLSLNLLSIKGTSFHFFTESPKLTKFSDHEEAFLSIASDDFLYAIPTEKYFY
jgi:hypothetical protein